MNTPGPVNRSPVARSPVARSPVARSPGEREEASQPVRAGSLGASQVVALFLSWTAVGIPLAWGVIETFRKALALFR